MASSAGLPSFGPDRAASSCVPSSGGRPPHRPHHSHPAYTTSGCVMMESVDDAEGLYVAVERCPLCSTSRRRLTCARCVQAGDFMYFDGRNAERFGTGSLLMVPNFRDMFWKFTATSVVLTLVLFHCRRCLYINLNAPSFWH